MRAASCESQMSFSRGHHLPPAPVAATERHLYFAQPPIFAFLHDRV